MYGNGPAMNHENQVAIKFYKKLQWTTFQYVAFWHGKSGIRTHFFLGNILFAKVVLVIRSETIGNQG